MLIFLLRPGDEKIQELPTVSEENPTPAEIEEASSESASLKPFIQLEPAELAALKEQAGQAIADQANLDRPHPFQRILFGKAASLLSDANTAMDKSEFRDAQIGYEQVLETVESLQESYQLADEIAGLKKRIQALDSTLQSQAVALLDSEDYNSVQSNLIESDQLLQEGQFQKAITSLEESEAALKTIFDAAEQQFREAIRKGLNALNSGDGDTATEHLMVAQSLRSKDSFVAQQLERAKVINRVYEHFNKGKEYEQQGLFSLARVDYQKALELDPDSVNINTRLQAINQTLNRDLFDTALAAGFEALSAGNGDAAVQDLEKATALMPGDSKARAALADARELQRRQLVDRLMAIGQKALKNQEWIVAKSAFQEALDYEPTSQQAQDGLATAEEQIAREERLRQFLLEAETFERNGEFEKALIVLREGRQVADPSGVVSEKIQLLESILEEQSKPQIVKIISDSMTEIEVYKVGKFEPSQELNLKLRPGEYTIVGSRLMYRDVRYSLVVKVGEAPDPIEVICQEKL
ncbi:MAG: tetratricopeptide repeat protein [Verrucomicrobia bacterium]|nr:tetratricopeptide repeat protein [Verrucomicrobiota bacterium]